VGYIHPTQILTAWLTSALRVSIIVTLMVGISTTVYEMMRERLDQATLVLRTKERDDADARKVAAEAQLASLESRVNPHFLFNTLNSIAALTHDDPAGAELDVARITHVFSKDKLSFAVVNGHAHVIDYTLTELEARLDPRRFVRIHRATIVNAAFVQELYPGVDGVLIRLKDDKATELSVARDRVRELKARLGI
jgi:hypothetical protein